MGRFLSRDLWPGQSDQPLSMNRWTYVYENPINALDPSGYLTEKESQKVQVILDKLEIYYGVHIVKDWGYEIAPDPADIGQTKPWTCQWREGNWRNKHELELTFEAVRLMAKELGGPEKFRSAMKDQTVDIKRYTKFKNWTGFSPHPALDQFFGEVMLFDGAFSSDDSAMGVVVHEFAHIWDLRNERKLSDGLADLIKPYSVVCGALYCTVVWDPESAIHHFPTEYSKKNKMEYWADSFMVYLFPSKADLNPLSPMVKNYVKTSIKGIP